MHKLFTTLSPLALGLTCVVLVGSVVSATEDHEHAQALKDFVPDHPHLHDLVDKTHQGDADAKHLFEKQSLSVRCKS